MPRRAVLSLCVLVGVGTASFGSARPRSGVDPASLARVRKSVHEAQAWAAHDFYGAYRILERLGPSDVPALVEVFRRVEDPRAFDLVADRLHALGATASIPILFDRLRRPVAPLDKGKGHPARAALALWDYRAVGPALRALGSDDPAVRLAAAQILVERAPYRPQDVRLPAAYRSLARSRDGALRTLAAQAFWASGIRLNFDRNGEGEGPTDVKSLADLAELAAMVRDEDDRIATLATDGLRHLVRNRWIFMWLDAHRGLRLPSDVQDVDVYRTQIASKEVGVRLAALALLAGANVPDREIYDALGDPAPEIRLTMERVLDPRGDAALASLTALASDPRDGVRASVARVLGRTFDPRALPCLRRLTRDASPPVRREARRAILRIEGP